MKRIRLDTIIAALLLTVLGLIVLHAPLTVFVESRWPNVADIAKAWKELLITAALVFIAVEYTRKQAWKRVVNDRLLWLIAAYAALHGVVALLDSVPFMATIAGLMIDLRYLAYFVAVYLFLRLYPSYQPRFLKVAMIGAAVIVGFAALQQVLPRDFLANFGYGDATIQPYLTVDENPEFVRHSSTLRGPNPLGAYAVMVLAAVVALRLAIPKNQHRKRHYYRLLLFGAAALVALWTSQSRSAWIAAVVAVGILFAIKFWLRFSFKFLAVLGVVALLIAGGVYAIRDSSFFHNVVLHDNPSTGAAVDSNNGHVDSLVQGTQKAINNPLGSGVGSTGSASLYTDSPVIIENQYLFVAHEVGWLGLGLFVAIVIVVLMRLYRARSDWRANAAFASGVGLAIIGVLLPVWVDDTVSIVWWCLVAVVLAKEGAGHGTTSNKEAKRAA